MAEEAKALMLAEAVAQVDGSAMAVEEREAAASASTGHIFKNIAVETGVDGTPVAEAARVDAYEQTLKRIEQNPPRAIRWSSTKRTTCPDLKLKDSAQLILCKI